MVKTDKRNCTLYYYYYEIYGFCKSIIRTTGVLRANLINLEDLIRKVSEIVQKVATNVPDIYWFDANHGIRYVFIDKNYN